MNKTLWFKPLIFLFSEDELNHFTLFSMAQQMTSTNIYNYEKKKEEISDGIMCVFDKFETGVEHIYSSDTFEFNENKPSIDIISFY